MAQCSIRQINVNVLAKLVTALRKLDDSQSKTTRWYRVRDFSFFVNWRDMTRKDMVRLSMKGKRMRVPLAQRDSAAITQ